MLQKLKSLLLDDTVYMAFLLFLVGVASFSLGRLSVTLPSDQAGSVVRSVAQIPSKPVLPTIGSTTPAGPVEAPAVVAPPEDAPKNFVASKSGTKFHALTCPGAKQIKDTNKIYFTTELEAEAAGYTRAANCKF
ncbi:hypothetical protein K2P47_01730 [Patescibacteria group bacterium]|nr:hypothetical protein [Patescibacteria group bacterium]